MKLTPGESILIVGRKVLTPPAFHTIERMEYEWDGLFLILRRDEPPVFLPSCLPKSADGLLQCLLDLGCPAYGRRACLLRRADWCGR